MCRALVLKKRVSAPLQPLAGTSLVSVLGRRSSLGMSLLAALEGSAPDLPRRYVSLVATLADPVSARGGIESALVRVGLVGIGEKARRLVERIPQALEDVGLAAAAADGHDHLGELLEDVVAVPQRRRSGQHLTPAWLVDQVLNRVGYTGAAGESLIDPSCGSGRFLLRAARRALAVTGSAAEVLSQIAGCDNDPLAVALARANLRLAFGPEMNPPVWCGNVFSVLPPELAARRFSRVVGNPPWVRWNLLSAEARAETAPLWRAYRLFSLSGMAAHLGGGEKDLAMLFVYACADRFLESGGRLAMVVTQELFKAKGAGEGFRRFHLAPTDVPLAVDHVDDLVAVRPFPGAMNKTAVLTLTKGRATNYPVPYTVWRPVGKVPRATCTLAAVREATRRDAYLAQPVGPEPTSAWQTLPSGTSHSLERRLIGRGTYRARRGASADPYGVFLVDVLGVEQNGTVWVRNRHQAGKRSVPETICRLETRYLFPAVRGADVRAWTCRPSAYLLLPQDPQTRLAVLEENLAVSCPLTLAYLEQHRAVLENRRSRAVQRLAARSAFYATIGVGTYTFAAARVLWARMANDLRACVVTDAETPFGPKPIVGIDTTAFVPLDSVEEAHYLCGLLNARIVRACIRSFSSAGRGFGSPGVLDRLALPRYEQDNAWHRELSRCAHQARCGEQPDIDLLVESILTAE